MTGEEMAAVDGRGRAAIATASAPTMEGGIAVAPPGFGAFAEDLVALDGPVVHVLAVRSEASAVIVDSGLLVGQELG